MCATYGICLLLLQNHEFIYCFFIPILRQEKKKISGDLNHYPKKHSEHGNTFLVHSVPLFFIICGSDVSSPTTYNIFLPPPNPSQPQLVRKAIPGNHRPHSKQAYIRTPAKSHCDDVTGNIQSQFGIKAMLPRLVTWVNLTD